MTVMVTGGCGLGGSFAVRYALDQGEDVVAFDIAIKTELLDDVKDRVRFVKGDISNASEVFGAVADNDVTRILHTASFLTGPAYDRPLAAAQTMVIGTLNVLEAARALKVERVVHVSTGKTVPTARQFAEAAGSGNVKIMPDPYTSHKVATELLCNDYRGLYDMGRRRHLPGPAVRGRGTTSREASAARSSPSSRSRCAASRSCSTGGTRLRCLRPASSTPRPPSARCR